MQVITVTALVENPNGDLVEYTVRPENRDFMKWETEAKKHNWGSPTAAPMLWQTFLLYSALHREKQIDSSLTFEQFADSVKYTSSATTEVNPTVTVVGKD